MDHSTHDLAVSISPADHVRGAATAPVTIVEYGDFECPRCKQTAPVLHRLLERFPGKVRLVYRHFPLTEVHPHALLAAEVSECAAGQGKFWAMHDLLFDHQLHLQTGDLRVYAAKLELDLTRYQVEIDDHVYLQRIREQVDGGTRSHVRATPGLFLNGKVIDVSFGFEAVVDAVERELEAN